MKDVDSGEQDIVIGLQVEGGKLVIQSEFEDRIEACPVVPGQDHSAEDKRPGQGQGGTRKKCCRAGSTISPGNIQPGEARDECDRYKLGRARGCRERPEYAGQQQFPGVDRLVSQRQKCEIESQRKKQLAAGDGSFMDIRVG